MPKFPWLTSDSLLSAWEHVLENAGCAGADGVTVDQFFRSVEAEIAALLREVETDEYRPLPLLPITVQKKPNSTATRTLMVPAVRDRVLQTAVGRQLGHAFEDEFLECSFAYRPKRSVNSAIARIRFQRCALCRPARGQPFLIGWRTGNPHEVGRGRQRRGEIAQLHFRPIQQIVALALLNLVERRPLIGQPLINRRRARKIALLIL